MSKRLCWARLISDHLDGNSDHCSVLMESQMNESNVQWRITMGPERPQLRGRVGGLDPKTGREKNECKS